MLTASDTLDCQASNIDYLRGRGGHLLGYVKDNQPSLFGLAGWIRLGPVSSGGVFRL